MEEQFRKMLQYFYSKANKMYFSDVYIQTLKDHLDVAEIQPIHEIAIKQIHKFGQVNNPITPIHKNRQFLYKNKSFASTFLFGFFLQAVKNKELCFLKDLHGMIINGILSEQNQFSQAQLQLITLKTDKMFQFLYQLKQKNYQSEEVIDKLYKKFYVSLLERRINRQQKYTVEAQLLLKYILSTETRIYSQKQLLQSDSNAYESNQLDFYIILKDYYVNEQLIIGGGSNCLKIIKNKKQYMIEKNNYDSEQEKNCDQLDEIWVDLLEESTQLRKQYAQNSHILTNNLNLTFDKSSTSRRAPKSVNFDPMVAKKVSKAFLP